jgi:DNA repair exonuclease SbcCD ATPase subunit
MVAMSDPNIREIHQKITQEAEEIEHEQEDLDEDLNTMEAMLNNLGDEYSANPPTNEVTKKEYFKLCQKLVEDARFLIEIKEHVKQLEEDERTYIGLINSIETREDSERKQVMKRNIGRVPKEKIQEIIEKEDQKVSQEIERTVNDIDRAIDLGLNLSENDPPNKSSELLIRGYEQLDEARASLPEYDSYLDE